MRSLETDITLDDVLTTLEEHYNNVKPWTPLTMSSFSYTWVKKRQYQIGGAPVKTTVGSCGVIPGCFPPDCIAKLKHDNFYGHA